MNIYTSYFAHLKKIEKDVYPIVISLGVPTWLEGFAHYPKLAPTSQILSKYKLDNDEKAYTEEFEKLLQNLDANEVVSDLNMMSRGNDVVLLCYEGPDKFCHRHLVAKWLSDKGYHCAEIL